MTRKSLMTIERHILEQERAHPQASGILTSLLYDMALCGKLIARETGRAALLDIIGAAGGVNASGEVQQKLDVLADEILFRMNDHTGRLCAMASEEHDDIIPIPAQFDKGRYVLLFDPLDGSSNIDVNMPLGTIFAFHRKVSDSEQGTIDDLLQAGSQLVAAGYIIYGPSTIMVYSTGQGVHGFTLDPTIGEFILSHPNIRVTDQARYYSVNQGNEKRWSTGVRGYVKWLQGIYGAGHAGLAHRYSGALVADFHRNLLQGGVYLYPPEPDKPGGKLRLLYEAQALAFIQEQAGGYASDGLGRLLDVVPIGLHQRVPFFIGNRDLVQEAERFIAQSDSEWAAQYRAYRAGQPLPS
jgi:fructose-1,6-bisphosphatase I